MTHGFSITTLSAVASICATAALQAQVVYVDDDALPGGDGSSWATAYNDLQDALAATSTGEIWVAAGFYTPGPPGDEASSFHMKNNVAIYGGFAGTETARDQRDWNANVTTLSGDVGRDDIYGSGEWNIQTGNSEHVVVADGLNSTAILDGFTVEAGHSAHNNGAGIYIPSGTPIVRHCIFDHNLAGFTGGGGAFVADGHATFEGCTFRGNWCHLMEGGAIYIWTGGFVTATDCNFVNNTSTGSGREAAGGAISSWGDGMTIERCTFTGNVARGFWPDNDNGGYGGAVHCLFGTLTVIDSLFDQNWSNAGGAIWTWTNTEIINSIFRRNQAPEYPRSIGDWGGEGGAIGAHSFQSRTITITNSTIVNNTAKKGGGITVGNNMSGVVSNTILWGNTDRAGNVGPSQIRGTGASYSCIQNMLEGEQGEDPPDPADFPNCIDLDPLFISPTTGDFHIGAGSPCIDAADNDALPAWVATDFDGDPRFIDDPDTADTGNGIAPIVDMGAFEFQVPASGVAELTGLQVLKGTIVGGTVDDLRVSDDAPLHTRSGFGSTLVDLHHMEMQISAVTTVDNPASLDLTIESRIDEPAGTAQVRLLNHNTQQYVLVGSHPLGSTDAIRTFENVDASNYVDPNTGELDLRIKHIVFVPFLAFTFDSFIDWVEIAVR